MKQIDNKKYYTVKELADILKVSRVTVFNWIKNGRVKAEKIGKTYIISADDAGAILKNNMTEQIKNEISQAVRRVVNEYGETLKLLGQE